MTTLQQQELGWKHLENAINSDRENDFFLNETKIFMRIIQRIYSLF
jgi:hypothetical protein